MDIAQVTAAGTLDPSFGRDGVLLFPPSEISASIPDAIVALPDGKLLVITRMAGTVEQPLILRLNEDGTLDTTYGASRRGYVELPAVMYPRLVGLNRSTDGGCVIGARFIDGSRSGTMVVRLDENGNFNNSFGEGGIVRINVWGLFRNGKGEIKEEATSDLDNARGNWRYSVVEDLKGRFVLVDQHRVSGGTKAIAVRLHPDGLIDYDFGEFGGAQVELPGVDYTWATAGGVAVQSDGKVLISGRYGDTKDLGLYVVRFDIAGKLDPEFNESRALTITSVIAEPKLSVSISKSDGVAERIVIAGEVLQDNEEKGLIVVLDSRGAFCRKFNKGNPLFSKLSYQKLGWSNMESLADGSVVVTGRGVDNQGDVATITARYLSNGLLDTRFNDGKGFVVYDVPGKSEVPTDMVVLKDRRIVISGVSTSDGWIIRYLG